MEASGSAARTIFSRSTFLERFLTWVWSDLRKKRSQGCQSASSVRMVPWVCLRAK